MEYTQLGNTGLTVSVAGLGCGGNSRIGQGSGLSIAHSVDLLRRAFDLGVNYFDSARSYGTEHIVARAFAPSDRSKIVLSTKSAIVRNGQRLSAEEVVANLDTSLTELATDYVDVFLLHGVEPQHYDYARETIKPALLAEQEKGKIRFIGLSETSPKDPEQEMLQRALDDPDWRVYMLALHMLNQGARHKLLGHTQRLGIGTLMMFVVRNIFSKPGLLKATLDKLAADQKIPAEIAADPRPLSFLIHEHGALDLIDAAYRFVRHEPGCNIVLFGTSRTEHLERNIASILRPPLPSADVGRLYELFAQLRGVGLELPDHVQRKSQGS